MSRIGSKDLWRAVLGQIFLALVVNLLLMSTDPGFILRGILGASGIIFGYLIAAHSYPKSHVERVQNAGIAVLMMITWLFVFGSTSVVLRFVLQEIKLIEWPR